MKIALAGALLINIASINAMGRVSARLGKVIESLAKEQIKRVPKEEIKNLNENTFEAASIFFSKKKQYAESLLFDVLHKRVKKGIVPTIEDIRKLDHYSLLANHGVLNLPGESGHTLLKNVLDLPGSPERRKLLKALYDRGAQLNARDIFVMGPEKLLKTYLNLPMESSAWTTVKVYRTFLKKNTEEKLTSRFNAFKMTGLQKEERSKKVKDAQEVYAQVEDDLLKERHFKFNELK